jgi:6-phosphogluconolactonase/glucosamine-6-phosphate isomerase/deaminase
MKKKIRRKIQESFAKQLEENRDEIEAELEAGHVVDIIIDDGYGNFTHVCSLFPELGAAEPIKNIIRCALRHG